MTTQCKVCEGFTEGQIAIVEVDGIGHRIPDIWIAGYSMRLRTTVGAALICWAQQCALARQYEVSR